MFGFLNMWSSNKCFIVVGLEINTFEDNRQPNEWKFTCTIKSTLKLDKLSDSIYFYIMAYIFLSLTTSFLYHIMLNNCFLSFCFFIVL